MVVSRVTCVNLPDADLLTKTFGCAGSSQRLRGSVHSLLSAVISTEYCPRPLVSVLSVCVSPIARSIDTDLSRTICWLRPALAGITGQSVE